MNIIAAFRSRHLVNILLLYLMLINVFFSVTYIHSFNFLPNLLVNNLIKYVSI